MVSQKLLALLLISIAVSCVFATGFDDADDDKRIAREEASMFLNTFKRLFSNRNEELREDNDELGERRAEAFEAYEEKCEPALHLVGIGKRACPPIQSCGVGFEPNVHNNVNPLAAAKPAKGARKP